MFKRIVVGLGKSTTGQLAAERAAVLAPALGATLHVVTAFKPGEKDSARDRPEAERQQGHARRGTAARQRAEQRHAQGAVLGAGGGDDLKIRSAIVCHEPTGAGLLRFHIAAFEARALPGP